MRFHMWFQQQQALITSDFLRADIEVICELSLPSGISESQARKLTENCVDGTLREYVAVHVFDELKANPQEITVQQKQILNERMSKHGIQVEDWRVLAFDYTPASYYDPDSRFDRIGLRELQARGQV